MNELLHTIYKHQPCDSEPFEYNILKASQTDHPQTPAKIHVKKQNVKHV